MSGHREKLTELAETFLNLSPEGRHEFLNRLAESDDPATVEWLSVLTKFDFLEKNR
jgi:hypothetical protein